MQCLNNTDTAVASMPLRLYLEHIAGIRDPDYSMACQLELAEEHRDED